MDNIWGDRMNWLISANGQMYNHAGAFAKWGFIDWRQTANYSVGDTVYIYCTVPIKKLKFKTVVEKINMSADEIVDDKEFWKNIEEYKKSSTKYFTRLKLISKIDSDLLILDKLKENGLKSAPQRPIKLKENILTYVESVFNDKFDNIIYPENDITNLTEGALKSIKINAYERNRTARNKSIEYHGYDCQVCGMNFEDRYGSIGKNYIHVHHIVPISDVNDEYIVDPIKDLIPVCPNCHAMLHVKEEGRLLSIDELKERMKYSRLKEPTK